MIESFINENGTLPRTILTLIVKYMRKTKGKLVTVTYKAVIPTRSLLQNKYYWGVVIKMLAKEIGYTPEVMHEYMKEKFLWKNKDYYDMPDGGIIYIKESTTNLSTIEFDNYIQEIRNWAGEFLSLDVPLPNQTNYDYTGYE